MGGEERKKRNQGAKQRKPEEWGREKEETEELT